MRGAGSWRYLFLLCAGCLLAPLLPFAPGWGWLLVLAAGAAAGLLRPATRLPALVFLGAVWFLGHAQWHMDRQWPEERSGEVVHLAGTVVGLPQQRRQSVRIVFRPDAGQLEAGLPDKIRVDWYRPREYLQPGARWMFPLRLQPPAGRDNPHDFDFQRHLLSRRVGAMARVAGQPERLTQDSGGAVFDRTRQRLSSVLQAETVNLDAAALKRALGVADRSGIAPELGDRLRHTGTAHLLAISGLHVGMVAGLAGLVAGWLLAPLVLVSRRLDRRRIALITGLLAALGYAALAGFTLPTQRALVMLAVVVVAFIGRRALAPGHALLLALTAVLAFDPLAPLAAGFWLSFAAVAVLIWAFAWRPGGQGRWLTGLVRAQAVIMIGLLPLNAGLFQQFVPGAMLANLVAIPLVGLWILPALLVEIGTILAGLPPTPAGALAEHGLVTLAAFLDWIDGFEAGHRAIAAGGFGSLLLAGAGAAWLLAPPGWPARWLGAALMLPLLVPAQNAPESGALEAWMLDVGTGLAVLVRTADETLLYDTGPGDGQGRDIIGSRLPAMLQRSGHSRPDRVVVSHAGRGHAGGIGSIHSDLPGERIYSSMPGTGRRCIRNQGWRSGAYRLRFLHPSVGLPNLGANSSCVLLISGPGGRMLLTGAIDSAVESRLVRDDGGPPADVLVLSAGGHARASSAAFLDAVAPRVALASAARFDHRGLPHAETRARLDAAAIDWFSTGRCGAIRVRLRPGRAPEVRSMATLSPRFWKARGDCP